MFYTSDSANFSIENFIEAPKYMGVNNNEVFPDSRVFTEDSNWEEEYLTWCIKSSIEEHREGTLFLKFRT